MVLLILMKKKPLGYKHHTLFETKMAKINTIFLTKMAKENTLLHYTFLSSPYKGLPGFPPTTLREETWTQNVKKIKYLLLVAKGVEMLPIG